MIRVYRYIFFPLLALWVALWGVHLFSLAHAASQQTSSTTAATIIDRAESLVNDTDNDLSSTAEMLVWLNDGMVDIASRTHCLEATESIDLATSTLEYSVTSTYLTVKAVLYVDSDGNSWALKKGSPASVGQNVAADAPQYWYDWAGKIGVYPTITRTTETITVYYITRPTAITSSDNITIPAIYDNALTLYVAAQAHFKDRQTGRYAQLMGLYLQELARLRGDLNEMKGGGEVVE